MFQWIGRKILFTYWVWPPLSTITLQEEHSLLNDSFLNIFIVVVYENFFQVQSEFFIQIWTKKCPHRQPLWNYLRKRMQKRMLFLQGDHVPTTVLGSCHPVGTSVISSQDDKICHFYSHFSININKYPIQLIPK